MAMPFPPPMGGPPMAGPPAGMGFRAPGMPPKPPTMGLGGGFPKKGPPVKKAAPKKKAAPPMPKMPGKKPGLVIAIGMGKPSPAALKGRSSGPMRGG